MHEPLKPPRSAAALWAPLAFFIEGEARLGRWAEQQPGIAFFYEFTRFGVKQGWACLFGGAMVALIVGTHLWYPRGDSLLKKIVCARQDGHSIAARENKRADAGGL